jgi:hypothetical protein
MTESARLFECHFYQLHNANPNKGHIRWNNSKNTNTLILIFFFGDEKEKRRKKGKKNKK